MSLLPLATRAPYYLGDLVPEIMALSLSQTGSLSPINCLSCSDDLMTYNLGVRAPHGT